MTTPYVKPKPKPANTINSITVISSSTPSFRSRKLPSKMIAIKEQDLNGKFLSYTRHVEQKSGNIWIDAYNWQYEISDDGKIRRL